MEDKNISRRSFVSGAAKVAAAASVLSPGAAFGATIVPRHVLGGPGYRAPSDTLNVAIVGAGGMGMSNAQAIVNGGQNIVALVDVDFPFVDRNLAGRGQNRDGTPNQQGLALQQAYQKARRFADFRQMLEQARDVEGVLIATPDHTHAAIAAAAMQMGKHVYVQKPLTYTVYEARRLADLARQNPRLATQMGNQGHSTEGARQINEWVQAGVIGPVREVHAWTNRPIWPQGLPRPRAADATGSGPNAGVGMWAQRNVSGAIAAAMAGSYPVPQGLNWDLFLGPAPMVEYHPIYHPFNWRGWFDWGVGALGDMGAHLIDHPFWALELGQPTSIEATSTPWGVGPNNTLASYPLATTVHYEFAARGSQPPVRMTWYDGGLMPERPAHLPDEITLDRSGGVIFIGDKGILMHETYGANPRLFPASLQDEANRVPKRFERVTTSHEMNWANAAMGQGKTTSSLEYGAALTETMLLGLVALRAGQGKKIVYDAKNMRVTNVPEANQFLHREYRSGWSL